MHALGVKSKLAPASNPISKSIQVKHNTLRHNNSKSYQFNSLWLMPTAYLRASVIILPHWQQLLSKFTVCYGDHLCGEREKHATASNV